MSLFAELQRAQNRHDAQQENAARLGYSVHRLNTTGVGDFRREKPINFEIVFTEPPLVTAGLAVVREVDADVWLPPRGGASVWKWKRNPKGHYTGAFIALWVEVNPVDGFQQGAPKVKVQHHLMFMGQGFKDLGDRVTTSAQLLSPRPSGLGG